MDKLYKIIETIFFSEVKREFKKPDSYKNINSSSMRLTK